MLHCCPQHEQYLSISFFLLDVSPLCPMVDPHLNLHPIRPLPPHHHHIFFPEAQMWPISLFPPAPTFCQIRYQHRLSTTIVFLSPADTRFGSCCCLFLVLLLSFVFYIFPVLIPINWSLPHLSKCYSLHCHPSSVFTHLPPPVPATHCK